jgi:hypothetical protein
MSDGFEVDKLSLRLADTVDLVDIVALPGNPKLLGFDSIIGTLGLTVTGEAYRKVGSLPTDWFLGAGNPAYYHASLIDNILDPFVPDSDLTGLTLSGMEAGSYNVNCSIEFASLPILVSDACSTALTDLLNQLNARSPTVAKAPEYGGTTLTPGTYTTAGASTHTGNITYNALGNPDAIFVIRIGAAHAVAAAASVTLINGAQAHNIFWVIVGAFSVGAEATLKGTYISYAAVSLGAKCNWEGRMLSNSGAIGMDKNTYSVTSGIAVGINLGILQTFAVFTKAGAISNTTIKNNTGDVSTGLGAISGFDKINGTAFGPNDTLGLVSFQLFQDGVPIAHSKRSVETSTFKRHDKIEISALATVTSGITVLVNVDLGDVVIGNAHILAVKL